MLLGIILCKLSSDILKPREVIMKNTQRKQFTHPADMEQH